MRRTKAEAAATRETILDLAELTFLEKGVSQTSLNEIASRAGLTRGAIYFHFRDKLAIYRAIIERIRFPQEELIEEAQKNNLINPIDILEKAALNCLERFAEDEHQQRVMTIITLRCEYVGDFSEMVLRLRQAHNGMLNLFERMLKVAKTRNMLADDWDTADAARVLVSVVGGIINEWLHSGKDFDLTKLGNRIVHTQITAFRKKA